jgi:hypothetical protein
LRSEMSTQPADPPPRESLELSVEEVLRRARPLPPREEMVIDDLTDEEQEAFWAAINE